MRRYRVFLALAAAALAAGARAQTPAGLEALAKEIEAERVKIGIPGVALAIVKDDKVILARGFGLRDVARKLPVTPDTLFAIGSSTKAFTAATVLMAVDAGKVSLDDSPKKYLPYFKMRDPETDAKITVRDLMRHNSGLPRTDLMMMAGADRLTRPQMIQAAGSARPTAKLGATFQYQNIMFTAAGEVAASGLKTHWETIVEKRIFAPLGMKTANLSVPRTVAAADHATGYDLNAATKTATPLEMRAITPAAPAGAINASVNDMTRWVRLMLGEGVFEGKRLLSAKSFAEMTGKQMTMTPTVGYGFGWFLREWKGHKVVEHGGNIDGFNAEVAFMPDQKLGLVLLTNVSNSSLGQGVMRIVWRNLVAAPADPPDAPTAPTAEVAAADEAGVYGIAGAPVKITVAFADGKLTMSVPGQPTYPLEKLSGRRYKMGGPLPDGYFATFRAAAADPKKNELLVEQPEGKFAFVREAAPSATAYTAPLSVDALLAKMVEAAGGAANLKRHRARRTLSDVEFENQGMTGKVETLAQIPNRSTGRTELIAAGRPIGWMADWFDGKGGGEAGSFVPKTPLPAPVAAHLRVAYDFYDGLLGARLLFQTIAIVGTETVGEAEHGIAPEECYVVELKPWDSAPIKWYVSTKTFRCVRRDGLVPEYLGDWRAVDGVQLPFLAVVNLPNHGFVVTRTRSVTFDPDIDPAVFAGPK